MSDYYIRVRGQVKGPFTRQKTLELIQSGQVSRFHECSTDGQSWNPVSSIPDLVSGNADTAPPRAQSSFDTATTNPAAPETSTSTTSVEWYYGVDGQSRGPVTVNELLQMAAQGQINRTTLVWRQGMDTWQPLLDVKPLNSVLLATTGQSTGPTVATQTMPGQAMSGPTEASVALRTIQRHLSAGRGWVMLSGIVNVCIAGVMVFAAIGSFKVEIGAGVFFILQALLYATVGVMGILLSQSMSVVRDYGTPEDIIAFGKAHHRFWLTVGLQLLLMAFALATMTILILAKVIDAPSLWSR